MPLRTIQSSSSGWLARPRKKRSGSPCGMLSPQAGKTETANVSNMTKRNFRMVPWQLFVLLTSISEQQPMYHYLPCYNNRKAHNFPGGFSNCHSERQRRVLPSFCRDASLTLGMTGEGRFAYRRSTLDSHHRKARNPQQLPRRNMMKLSGKVAVVTGTSRGVGKAIALALGREGASVVVAARSEREVEEFPGTIYHTAEQIGKEGGTALPIKVDVTRAAEVDAMAQRVLSEFGRVDILINNAGVIGPTMSFLEIPIDLWDRIMRVNVRGLFLCTRALAPIMVRQGSGCIVNVSSGAARRTGFL